MEDRVYTGYNVDTIKQVKENPKTEAYVKALSRENTNLVVNKDTIEPLNNNVIVRAKIATSIIALPTADNKVKGQIIYTEIFKLSKKLLKDENYKEIVPGVKCRINTQLALNLAGGPCYEEKDKDCEWIYFKADIGLVDYIYDFS